MMIISEMLRSQLNKVRREFECPSCGGKGLVMVSAYLHWIPCTYKDEDGFCDNGTWHAKKQKR